MALLKKTLFDEKLETYNVLVEDTAPFSDYFKITELPDVFTGGKNAFLIQGSPELVADSLIKIQIKDSQGNIIYHEPGEGIPEYYEGTSKVIAVYIYPDTSFGPCTITILGELKEYYSNRILNPVPLNWEGTYNVRWQKQVNVNPLLQNTSKIRFYRRPKVNIEETILPIYNRSVNRVTISGSVDGIAVNPIEGTNFRTFKGDTIYELKISGSNFSSSMEGETITISNLNQSYSTTIKDVITLNKAYATLPYYETSSVNSAQLVKQFTSASFELAYNESVTLTNSSISSSFAKIKLTDLEAFSGDVNRLKIFASRKADIGNYALLEDIQLESTELLQIDSYSGSIAVRTGQFTSNKLLNDFWTYRDNVSGPINPIEVDNTVLASSVKLLDSGVLNTTNKLQKALIYKYSLDFTKDTEYQLDFTPLLSSSFFDTAYLEAYVFGEAFVNTDTDGDGDIEVGKMIAKVESNKSFQKFDKQQFNFKADATGKGEILFANYQGNWHLSNISLRAASESSFSPNEISLNVAVPTKVKNDTFDFKFEFYDINNNYVPVNLNQEFTFSGGNDSIVRKSISVIPDGNLFSFSGSGESIGVSSINFDISKVSLTGSTTFHSSAFDENGNYIQPSVYASQPFYPGLLTNVTSASATLTVANFTGSLASPKVTRILYTASCEDVRDLVSIYRIDQGSTGANGADGVDSLQYVLVPINGTTLKNKTGTLELQLRKINGTSVTDVNSGNIKIVTGSANTIVNVGGGVTAGANGVVYNPVFNTTKISGSLLVKAYDFDNSSIVDSITLIDVTDGLTVGSVNTTNGLVFVRNPNNSNNYNPSNTLVTASFFDIKGNQYNHILSVSASFAGSDRLKYVNVSTNANIALSVTDANGSLVLNDTYVDTKGINTRFTFTDPNTNEVITASETFVIASDGEIGKTFLAIANKNQFVYDPDNHFEPAQANDFIDIKFSSNVLTGSLEITSGSFLPKLQRISNTYLGYYTESVYRIYSGNDEQDVAMLGTNAASWSYYTPTNLIHKGTYLFTQGGFSASVQLEGVLKGDKSKNLNAASNANQFFYKMTDVSLSPSGQTITIDIKRNNLGSTTNAITVTSGSGKPALTVGSNNGTTGVQSYSINGSNYPYSAGATTYTFFAEDLNFDGYTDTITITPVIAESQIAVNVSNENTTFPAYSGGTVFGGFLASSGSISVKVGSEDITYASTIANNRFSASIASSTNVTPVLTNNNYSITALSADSGSIDLKVTYRDGRGSDSVFNKIVTYSKAKAGTPNVLVAVSPSAQTIAANSRTSGSATPSALTITALEAGTSRFTSIGTPVYTNGLTGTVSSNTITFTSTASSIAGSTAQVTIPVNYTDSEGVSGTKNVVATVSKALASAPSTIVSIEKDGQTITRSKTGTYGAPTSFRLYVLEGANSSSYDNTSPFASSTFRITNVTNGTLNATDLDKYATITPDTPGSTSGLVVSITGSYVDSEGSTTTFLKTHNVNVATDGSDGAQGASGPGIVFRGVWNSTTTYYDTDDSPTRRDAVLYNGTYYATKTNATTNLNKQPDTQTTFWESLGTESFFVAAEIAIFRESFVKNTLNVGTNTSGNANITLYGVNDKPYISIGQGTQTYGSNGIWLGISGSAFVPKVSFVSGSSYFKYDAAAASDSIIEIGGKITSTAGSIGGWSLDNGTLTGGSVILDAVNGRITAGGVNGVVISGSLGIVAGTPLNGVRPFSVGLNGLLYASNATISGSIFATTITANSGLIGGWNIDGSGMYKYNTSGDTVVRLDSAGSQISVSGPSSTVQIKDKLTTNFSGAGGHGSTGASSWVSVNSSGDAASSIAGTTLYAGMASSAGSVSLSTSAQTFSNLAANTTYNLTLKLKFRFKLESGYENGSRVQTLVHSLNTTNDYYVLRDWDYDPFSYGTPIGEQLYNDWQYQTSTSPYRWLLESGGGYENSQGDIASGVSAAYNDLLQNYVGDTTTIDYRNFISGIVKPNFTITKNGFSATSFVEKSVVYGVDTLSAINPTYDTSTSVPSIPTIGTNAYLRPITNTDYIETSEYTLTSAISVPSTGFNNGFAINVSNIFNSVNDYYHESAWGTAAYNTGNDPIRSVRWDTLIETDSGTKMAKDILETDLLKIWDNENNKFIFRPYSFKYNKLYKNYYFVKVDENELYVSSNHNFWLENGEQINVKDLVEGVTELFVKYDNIIVPKFVEVVSEIQSDGDEFITFTIEQYENYLSNNIISHNIAPVGGSGTTVNFIYAIGSNNSFTCKVKNIEMQVTSITMSAVSKFVEVTATGIQAVFDSNQTVNAFSIKGFDSGGTAIVPSTSAFNINSAGYWKHTGEIHSTGDIVGFTTAGASDERLKDNIQNVTEEDYLKLKELVPVTYSWISDEEKHKHYGLIAQQVEKIFPELTRKKVFGKYMTINYIGLIPILVGMIQNQNERIKDLENKLNGSN